MSDTDTDRDDPVAVALSEIGPSLVGALNTEYGDSVLFVTRVLARPGITAARVTGLDRGGIDVVATDGGGERPVRLDFAAPVTDVSGLTPALFALVARARRESGEDGMTSVERMAAEMRGIRTFLTEVAAVEDVHAHLRRITFRGGDLSDFAPLGPDTFLYLLLPPPGRTELTIGRDFSWEAVGDMPEEERPVGAYYTVRAWRPEGSELDMLFVLHDPPEGDGGGDGPASGWARRARPGDRVALWGPREAYGPPAGTDWYLLVADETGLPAVANILESLPPGTTARVFAEVADESEHQDLPSSPSFAVTWLHRDGAPAGTTTLLSDAVRAMPWPGGRPYVWGGGESRAMTAVRNYVRRELDVPRPAVSLVAYWRHASTPPEDTEPGG